MLLMSVLLCLFPRCQVVRVIHFLWLSVSLYSGRPNRRGEPIIIYFHLLLFVRRRAAAAGGAQLAQCYLGARSPARSLGVCKQHGGPRPRHRRRASALYSATHIHWSCWPLLLRAKVRCKMYRHRTTTLSRSGPVSISIADAAMMHCILITRQLINTACLVHGGCLLRRASSLPSNEALPRPFVQQQAEVDGTYRMQLTASAARHTCRATVNQFSAAACLCNTIRRELAMAMTTSK